MMLKKLENNSNTTFVKVKLKIKAPRLISKGYSNTTFVKVKC